MLSRGPEATRDITRSVWKSPLSHSPRDCRQLAVTPSPQHNLPEGIYSAFLKYQQGCWLQSHLLEMPQFCPRPSSSAQPSCSQGPPRIERPLSPPRGHCHLPLSTFIFVLSSLLPHFPYRPRPLGFLSRPLQWTIPTLPTPRPPSSWPPPSDAPALQPLLPTTPWASN